MGEKEESCSDFFFLKREREQEDSCSSESSVESQIVHKKRRLNRSEMWIKDWDAPFLNILNDACAGKYPSIRTVFTNGSWRLIATWMQEAVGDPLIKPDDCKERGKHFRKMYNDSKAIDDPSPLQEQLRIIFGPKSVPKFPRRTANPLSSSSLVSTTMSKGSRSRSRSGSGSGAKHWKLDLVVALSNLVTSHNLNLQAVDEISDKLDTEMKVLVFLGLHPDQQAKEIMHLIGRCAFLPVESPPSASTQLAELPPSASTQPFEFL